MPEEIVCYCCLEDLINLLECQLARDKVGDLVRKVEHDLGHEHVLESQDGGRILHAVKSLEGLTNWSSV